MQFLKLIHQLKENTQKLSPSKALQEIIKVTKYQEYLASLDFESR
jgi:hypothetical protein